MHEAQIRTYIINLIQLQNNDHIDQIQFLKAMRYNQPVFAELFGLVVFDFVGLARFQNLHNLGEDLLESFTTLDLGEQVSESGIAIPITGIPGDYYHWTVCNLTTESSHLKDEQVVVKPSGWILYTPHGEATVCGIGYLKKFDVDYFASSDKFIRLELPAGWNEVTIVGGIDDAERLVYELRVTPALAKPRFRGDFEASFSIIAN